MGFIKRLADKRYLIKYDIVPTNGKPRQIKTKTLEGYSKQQAEAILAQRKAEVAKQREAIARGERVKDEITLSQLFEEFISKKTLHKEATTVARYRALFRLYLAPACGEKKTKHLRPHHLMDCYDQMMRKERSEKPVSARTVRHAHELLRNVLNWGVRRGYVSQNVALRVDEDDLPKAVKPTPLALTQDELDRVLSEAQAPTSRAAKRGTLSSQPWFYAAVALSAHTGARRGEVLALRWSDVNLEAKCVTIARSITEKMTFKAPKNDRSRTIEIGEKLCTILRAHRVAQAKERLKLDGQYQEGDLVFARADGCPLDPWNYARAVRDLVLRAGVTPITLHGLRDTHASLLAQAGVSMEVISKRLGHASIGVTMDRYMYVYKERDRNAAAAFDALVS